jgi:hypothetical protein
MHLKLKITGPHVMHGRLPGEEFYVRANDTNGMPINSLWAKRLAEESQHGGNYVSVLERVDALPTGTQSLDDTAVPPPPATNYSELERRLMEAVARALSGIRSEIGRIPKTVDSRSISDLIRTEIARATQHLSSQLSNERLHAILVSDAYRVRMSLPPGWHTGSHIDISASPLIESYAARHHNGDVGAAAITLTDEDMRWQQEAADKMRLIVDTQ